MNRLKSISLLLIFLLVYSILLSIDLNENEMNYISERQSFTVLVSNNNFPYEYINHNNEIAGINIDFIKRLLAFTNKKVIFTTDTKTQNPDIISSFVDITHYPIHTEPLFLPEIYFLINTNRTISEVEHFIIINQEYLLREVMKKYPDNTFVIVDNIRQAINLMTSKPNSIIAFDSFNKSNLSTFNMWMDDFYFMEHQDYFVPQFYLTTNDHTLYTLLSKSIKTLEEDNRFYKIFRKYQNLTLSNYLLRYNHNHLIVVIIVIATLIIINCYLLYIFKVYKLTLGNITNNLSAQNEALLTEKESLKIQLETIKANNYNLLETINTIAFIVDLKGNIIFINQYSKILLGYTPDELIGQNIDKIVENDHKYKILNLSLDKKQKENIEGESKQLYEIELVTKEGLRKYFIYSTYFSKLYEDKTYIYCILHDVSDLKIMERQVDSYSHQIDEIVLQRTKELRESEEKFKFVINSAYDSIFMMQGNQFTFVNDAFFTMTKLPEAHIKENMINFFDILAPNERANVVNQIAHYHTQQDRHFILNTKIVNFHGTELEVEIHFTILDSDKENSFLGIIHEIGQKKEHEFQKLQAERISVITKYAITTNDRINSPLNAIQGYVELLEHQIANPKVVHKKAFANIFESIEKIKTVLKGLQELTEYKTEKYNLGDLSMLSIKKEDAKNE